MNNLLVEVIEMEKCKWCEKEAIGESNDDGAQVCEHHALQEEKRGNRSAQTCEDREQIVTYYDGKEPDWLDYEGDLHAIDLN